MIQKSKQVTNKLLIAVKNWAKKKGTQKSLSMVYNSKGTFVCHAM